MKARVATLATDLLLFAPNPGKAVLVIERVANDNRSQEASAGHRLVLLLILGAGQMGRVRVLPL